jgi:hypothetical protein
MIWLQVVLTAENPPLRPFPAVQEPEELCKQVGEHRTFLCPFVVLVAESQEGLDNEYLRLCTGGLTLVGRLIGDPLRRAIELYQPLREEYPLGDTSYALPGSLARALTPLLRRVQNGMLGGPLDGENDDWSEEAAATR